MSKTASFSLTRALSEAAAFVPQALAGAWLILIALWAFLVFGPQATLRLGADMHAHRIAHLVFGLAVVVLKLMSLGALYRVALFGKRARNEGLGLGGVQLEMPELRLFGAGIVVGLFWLLIAAALFIVFAIAFKLSGLGDGDFKAGIQAVFRREHGPIDWAFIAYAILAHILLAFLAVKFCLFHAATVAEKRMVTLNALGLSSGNVGKLFAGIVVTLLPLILLGGLAFHHLHRHFVLSPRPPAFDTPHLHLILHAALGALAVFAVMPFGAGFFASAYRQITKLRSV